MVKLRFLADFARIVLLVLQVKAEVDWANQQAIDEGLGKLYLGNIPDQAQIDFIGSGVRLVFPTSLTDQADYRDVRIAQQQPLWGMAAPGTEVTFMFETN